MAVYKKDLKIIECTAAVVVAVATVVGTTITVINYLDVKTQANSTARNPSKPETAIFLNPAPNPPNSETPIFLEPERD